MKIVVSNIIINVSESIDSLLNKIVKQLKLNNNHILSYKILKRSIDARKKPNIFYVYKLLIELEKPININKLNNVSLYKEEKKQSIKKISTKKEVFVIGAGPAGLFSALKLLDYGFKVTLVERGKPVKERIEDIELFKANRILNNESNIAFGLGGAGTFSDGKLQSGIKDSKVSEVLKIFNKYGAYDNILYDAKPHIGTDVLRIIVQNMADDIIKKGGRLLFNSKLEDINIKDGKIESVIINNDTYKCDTLILALGHSAKDTIKMLIEKGLDAKSKPFSMGVRVEHPQKFINKIQYGMEEYKYLPPADYKVAVKLESGRGVYSFCMCPGGEVVESQNEPFTIVTNGMSYNKRNLENANSAILVSVEPSDFGLPLDGFEFQEKYEKLAYNVANNYDAPIQKMGDFMKKMKTTSLGSVNPSVKPGYVFSNLWDILPEFVSESLKEGFKLINNKIPGYLYDDAILTAIESRSSCPVMFIRNDDFESNIKGIYPIGEGSGHSGGITSSAVEGLNVANIIYKKYV